MVFNQLVHKRKACPNLHTGFTSLRSPDKYEPYKKQESANPGQDLYIQAVAYRCNSKLIGLTLKLLHNLPINSITSSLSVFQMPSSFLNISFMHVASKDMKAMNSAETFQKEFLTKHSNLYYGQIVPSVGITVKLQLRQLISSFSTILEIV